MFHCGDYYGGVFTVIPIGIGKIHYRMNNYWMVDFFKPVIKPTMNIPTVSSHASEGYPNGWYVVQL